MTPPACDCPACHAPPRSLEYVATVGDGAWWFCSCCASTLLVRAGAIVKVCRPL